MIAGLADEIAVMYAGRIVETGPRTTVLDRPLHPYTHGLIGSVPSRNRRGERLRQIPGMTPSLLNLPPGCAFRARCPRADASCEQETAPSQPTPGQTVRCFHPLNLSRLREGRCASANRVRVHRSMAAPIIELRGVSKRFGPTYDAAARLARSIARHLGTAQRNEIVHAVDNVDLVVARGEVVGLVGESGCGKSTLGRMVAGIMPPTDGDGAVQGPGHRRAAARTVRVTPS